MDKLYMLTQVTVQDNSYSTLQPSDIPPTIPKIRQYFDQIFPKGKGGNLTPGIRLEFYGYRSTIIKNAE